MSRKIYTGRVVRRKKSTKTDFTHGKNNKPFNTFVRNRLYGYNNTIPQKKLISLISEEYNCSYATAFYRLKEFLRDNKDIHTEWRGHNKHKVVKTR